MIAYRKEKIKNAICYFASEHYKRTKSLLFQTILYKFLAYLDFKSVEVTGKPSLGLEYTAYPKGPVPPEIRNKRYNYKTDCFEFIDKGNNYFVIESKKEPNLDYFSEFEIEVMNELLDEYSILGMQQKDIINKIIDDSHKDIIAWKIARERPGSSRKMYYEDTFNTLYEKKVKDLTIQKEAFLTYKDLQEIT